MLKKKTYDAFKFLHDEIPYKTFRGRALSPLKVIIELTYRCNLACEMCYLIQERKMKETRENVTELTTAEVKGVIDQLGMVFPIVTFTGGEPLIRSDIMELIRYTQSILH